jgi:Tfp pilus assembly protein PilP
MRPSIAFVIGVLAVAQTVGAQAPAGGSAVKVPAQVQPVTPPTATPATPQPDPYTYQMDGRRDPFLSLVDSGSDAGAIARTGEGAAGLTVAEVSVRGVLQTRGALIAMIHGADNKTYIVHQGDKLADGTIKTITPQGLIIVQEVSDPLSLVKQREVRKLLRSLEDAKE